MADGHDAQITHLLMPAKALLTPIIAQALLSGQTLISPAWSDLSFVLLIMLLKCALKRVTRFSRLEAWGQRANLRDAPPKEADFQPAIMFAAVGETCANQLSSAVLARVPTNATELAGRTFQLAEQVAVSETVVSAASLQPNQTNRWWPILMQVDGLEAMLQEAGATVVKDGAHSEVVSVLPEGSPEPQSLPQRCTHWTTPHLLLVGRCAS